MFTSSRAASAFVASIRASVSNASTRSVRRCASSSMLPIVSRSAAGSLPSRNATSPTARNAVSGERNSCDASAVNRCNSANEASSRASVSLNTVARRPSSSFGFGFGKRFESDSELIRRACRAIASSGRNERVAIR